MSNPTIPFHCPQCSKEWRKDKAVLDAQRQRIKRGDAKPPHTKEYRDACPQCGTYAVVTVELPHE